MVSPPERYVRSTPSATRPDVRATSAGSSTVAPTREYVPTVVGIEAWKAVPVGAGVGVIVGVGGAIVTTTPGTTVASGWCVAIHAATAPPITRRAMSSHSHHSHRLLVGSSPPDGGVGPSGD